MSLKPLLTYALESEELSSLGEGLRRKRQSAFVSASMRPYLLASVLEAAYGAAERPAVVVTGEGVEWIRHGRALGPGQIAGNPAAVANRSVCPASCELTW